MTIRDFLEMCTLDSGAFALYDLNSNSVVFGHTNELDDIAPQILDAELISWDYADTLSDGDMICLNYKG